MKIENKEISLSETIFINFMAHIDPKRAAVLLSSISDAVRMGVKKIKINISSPGGSVFHAISLYNFLRGLQNVEVHTHNFGQVDSAAIVLFLAGDRKTASSISSFLFHGPKRVFSGGPQIALSKKELKDQIEILDSDTKKLIEIIARASSQSKDKISQFFEVQKVLSAQEALTEGLIDEIVEDTIPTGANVTTITDLS